jgi:hypothetical protein
VTDTAGNNASAEGIVAITYSEEPGFPLEVQAEAFTVIDTVGTTGAALTQARVPGNIEGTVPVRDVNGDGLWDGFTGAGYMDMGGNSGDAVQFTVDAPSAGTYTLEFRYSNGGTTARPMTLSVNGTGTATPQFASTGSNGWDNWQTESLNVTLAAGTNTIRLAQNQGSGPNFDKVTVFPDTTADSDSNLTFSAVDLADPAQAVFRVTGLDSDIASVAVLVNGGAPQVVVPGFSGQFSLDLSALGTGDANVQIIVTDTSGNTANASTVAAIAVAPFALTIQGESLTVLDTNGIIGLDLTQPRDPATPRAWPPAAPPASGTGIPALATWTWASRSVTR